MADDVETDKFYFHRELIVDVDDSEYTYEKVPVDDGESEAPDDCERIYDEDLQTALQTINEAAFDEQAKIRYDYPRPQVICRPEPVDDFVRNFLLRTGLHQTLDCFQNEWYEMQEKGQIDMDGIGTIQDVYSKNQLLSQQLEWSKAEGQKYKEAAAKARDTYLRLCKERDYHRTQHRRVQQEKCKLIEDIRRLKAHYAAYEPTLHEMKRKYETAMKEKMLTRLEKEKYCEQLQELRNHQQQLQSLSSGSRMSAKHGTLPELSSAGGSRSVGPTLGGGAKSSFSANRNTGPQPIPHPQSQKGIRHKYSITLDDIMDVFTSPVCKSMRPPKLTNIISKYTAEKEDSKFPRDTGVNPLLPHVKELQSPLLRSGGPRLGHSFLAHSNAISRVVMHPSKQMLATTSDDRTWKLWNIPSGEMILCGAGHTDWVADCDFDSTGTRLVTVSGDTSVRVWDLNKADCRHTFLEHQKPVWGCSWHSCGDFIATCSMDKNSKIWDLNSLRCRNTLRGHTDSVNSIQFLYYSNTVLTASADKTVSMWDARTGICGQTFFGHIHSVNHCSFNLRGNIVASCDSFGVTKLWDVRNVSELTSIDVGPHQANMVAFDPTGALLAIASNDGSIRTYDMKTGTVQALTGHEEAVQCVAFSRTGEFLVSGGSDLTVEIWN